MISRKMILASACLALGIGSIGSANASLSAGQWDINGIRQICLLGTGTWYGINFGPWTGRWEAVPQPNGERFIIYGNYNAGSGFGSGNTSMVVNKADQANWTDLDRCNAGHIPWPSADEEGKEAVRSSDRRRLRGQEPHRIDRAVSARS